MSTEQNIGIKATGMSTEQNRILVLGQQGCLQNIGINATEVSTEQKRTEHWNQDKVSIEHTHTHTHTHIYIYIYIYRRIHTEHTCSVMYGIYTTYIHT